MHLRRLVFAVLGLGAALAGAAVAEPAPLERASVATLQRLDCPSPCPRLAVEGYWRIGPSDGFLQTPRGGGVGTTSPERPTLDELGITTVTEFGIAAHTTWRRHEIAFQWNIMLLSGESVLERGLVSQDDFFPAGTSLDSESWLGTYRLGYRYRIDVPLGGRERLVVMPGAGLTGLDVDYRVKGSNGRDTDRTYLHGAPHVDLNVSWRPSGCPNLVLEGEASQTLHWFLGDGNQMDILEARLRLAYEPSRRVRLFFETGWRRTDWQDDQEVENHIHVEYGPWFGFGLGVRF